MQTQRVTQIVQSNTMRELRVKHRHHMTPGAKAAAELVHPSLARQLRDQKRRNQIAELMKSGKGMATLVCFFVFHTRIL